MNDTNPRFVPSSLVAGILAGAITVAFACDRQGAPASEESTDARDQSWEGTTKSGNFRVEVTPQPNPIPFQQLFELRVEVASAGESASVESLKLDQVRARMPAHDHGMKTAPEISSSEPGRFRVRGMKFHMRGRDEDGRWVIELLFQSETGLDRAQFDVQCCTG